MLFKGLKIGKQKEKPDEATAEAGDTPVNQAVATEEPVSDKPEVPEATEPQPEEAASTAGDSKEDEEAPPQPHGPLVELELGPEDIVTDKEPDFDTPPEEAEEEVTTVEVGTGIAAPAEAEKETPKAEESDSLGSLFSQDEEEVNPLANLIDSLPDVTVQELLDDIQEIKGIVQEWQQQR